jgi:hypothetical protein
MGAQFRQGDVLVIEVDGIPSGAVPVSRAAGELVLAHGEVTGHRHAITDPRAELLSSRDDLFLRVLGSAVVLTHQEHDPIAVPPGSYQVIRQREYAPAAPRSVAD